MFPLVKLCNIPFEIDYFFALIIGLFFGFALEQAGFGNARKLAATFYFKDMTVVKVMFTAIITAMTGLILLINFELLDVSLYWINPTYLIPGIVGGLLMGVGFIVGGYCPGTGIVGVATGKVDAFYNLLGGFTGIFVFIKVVPFFYDFYNSSYMGKRVTLSSYFDISLSIVGVLVLVMAIGMFIFSEYAEKKWGRP